MIFILSAKPHPFLKNLQNHFTFVISCFFYSTNNLFSIALHISYTTNSKTGQYKEHLLCQKCLGKPRKERLLRAIVWTILRSCEEVVS